MYDGNVSSNSAENFTMKNNCRSCRGMNDDWPCNQIHCGPYRNTNMNHQDPMRYHYQVITIVAILSSNITIILQYPYLNNLIILLVHYFHRCAWCCWLHHQVFPVAPATVDFQNTSWPGLALHGKVEIWCQKNILV